VKRRFSRKLGWDVLGLLVFVVLVFPVYWMVATAFKHDTQIYGATPTWFPRHPTLTHFSDVIHRQYFWTDVKNSVIIVVATVFIALALSFFAAVALAKYRFSGRKLFIVLVIAIQMIPQAGLIIPLYKLLANHGQVDKLTGVIVVYLTFALPFCIWTLRGFLLGIPKDLEEAAMVDGSSRVGAFVRILLPLVAPGLVATSVFAFITSWNEYIFASTLLSTGNKQTITVFLANLYGGNRFVDWGEIMAASTLIAIPVVIFFMLVQRRIAFGLTAGAVRG
jgi:N,N'-diacetylchitobiose transport system permease protein